MGNYFDNEDLLNIESSLAKVTKRQWILGAGYVYVVIILCSYYFSIVPPITYS